MDLDAFAGFVSDALDELPEEFQSRLENIQVDVEEWPSTEDLVEVGLGVEEREHLLGLYHGVPLTDRTTAYMALPDRITIYMRPILRVAGTSESAIIRQIRHTVVHEIAHYYGIDDDRLEELGAY